MKLHLPHTSVVEEVSELLPSTRSNACAETEEVVVNPFSDLYVTVYRFSLAEEDRVATSRRGRGGVVPHLRSVLVALRQTNILPCLSAIKTFSVMLFQRNSMGFRRHLLHAAGGWEQPPAR